MIGIEWVILYSALGALVGFLSGLLGVGGGGILVPLLAMAFHAQGMGGAHILHYSLGTAFACMMFSSAASARAHAAYGNVAWKAFYGMSGGILLGTFFMTRIATHIHSSYIAAFFACFMALIAAQMFFNWRPRSSSHPASMLHLSAAGMGIGSISALAAVGGGFLSITYLHYKTLPMKKAIGTSAAIGFPIAVAGTLGYVLNGWPQTAGQAYMLGFIYLPAFLPILLTSTAMAAFGARFSRTLSDARLRKAFALVCLALSIKMLFSIL